MTAEMRWASSTFVYSYLIFSKLMLQPLSFGDSFTQEEMKRLSGGKSLGSSPPKKQPCFLASESYNYRSSITKYTLERCLSNLNLFDH